MFVFFKADMVGLPCSLPGRVVPVPLNVILGEKGFDHRGGSEENIIELETERAKGLLDGN